MLNKSTKSYIIVSIILLVLVLSVVVFVLAFSGSGNGTLGNPFEITTCSELQEINQNFTAYYILMNDIDCSTFGFHTIAGGSGGNIFSGTFDGQNYTVSNIKIISTALYQSVFGYVSEGVIKNVGFKNLNVTMNAPSGDGFVGGVAGIVTGGSNITKVFVSGNIYGTRNFVGSIVGYMANGGNSNILDSYSNANVTCDFGYCGGISGGASTSAGNITNTYFNGYIFNGTANSIGGIVGSCTGGCPTTKLKGSNNFYDQETTLLNNNSGTPFGKNKSTSEMKQQATFTNWDFSDIWYINEDLSYPHLRIEPFKINSISPLNNSHNSSLNMIFTCNVTTNSQLSNITLYIWNSTGGLINNTETNNVSGTFNSTDFSISLPYSNYYSWNCLAYDGVSNFASSNHTLDAGNLTRCRDLDENDEVYYLNEDLSTINNCFEIKASNVILNGKGHSITSTSGSPIYINGNYDNLRINNTILDGGDYAINIDSSTSSNNSLINVTYTDVLEYIVSGSELIRKWYFDINLTVLTTPYSFPTEYEARVNLYNDSEIIAKNLINLSTTVNHNIDFAEKIMIEYINNGGTKTYYYPTITANHDAYYPNTTTYNLSTNILGDRNITMLAKPGTGFPSSSTSTSSTSTSSEPTIIYIPENKTYCGDLICQKDGNDFDVKENYWNCIQDCPGAIGENFDELIYSLTKYCFDKDPSTICFFTQQLFSVTLGIGENLTISCGDNLCEAGENFINCEQDCGGFNLDTMLKGCFDDDKFTPCFFNTNLAIYVLFGGFGLFLALSMIKIKAPGERRKVSTIQYIKIKLKKRKRRR